MIYDSVGDMITAARIVLLDGDNISFDASLVSTNSSSIPSTVIINRMLENQNHLYIVPLIEHIIIVCNINTLTTAKKKIHSLTHSLHGEESCLRS